VAGDARRNRYAKTPDKEPINLPWWRGPTVGRAMSPDRILVLYYSMRVLETSSLPPPAAASFSRVPANSARDFRLPETPFALNTHAGDPFRRPEPCAAPPKIRMPTAHSPIFIYTPKAPVGFVRAPAATVRKTAGHSMASPKGAGVGKPTEQAEVFNWYNSTFFHKPRGSRLFHRQWGYPTISVASDGRWIQGDAPDRKGGGFHRPRRFW